MSTGRLNVYDRPCLHQPIIISLINPNQNRFNWQNKGLNIFFDVHIFTDGKRMWRRPSSKWWRLTRAVRLCHLRCRLFFNVKRTSVTMWQISNFSTNHFMCPAIWCRRTTNDFWAMGLREIRRWVWILYNNKNDSC